MTFICLCVVCAPFSLAYNSLAETSYVKATEVQGESMEVGAKVMYKGREMTVSKAVDGDGDLKMLDLSVIREIADMLAANKTLTSVEYAAVACPITVRSSQSCPHPVVSVAFCLLCYYCDSACYSACFALVVLFCYAICHCAYSAMLYAMAYSSVCYLLFAICCLLSAVCYLLFCCLLSVCDCFCLLAFLLARLSACSPFCLLAFLLARLSACLPFCLLAFLLACFSACLLFCLLLALLLAFLLA